MDLKNNAEGGYRQPNRIRRMLVGGAALGYASLSLSLFTAPVSAAPANSAINPSATPPTAAERDAFLRVSQFLTGRTTLDATQTGRLFQALTGSDAQFPAHVQALAAFIVANSPDPLQLQALLDDGKQPFAALPRQIATAWYIGVVGQGEAARCITYASSLMNVTVWDHLRPPSYAYGAYGTWAAKPAATITAL
jgi:hypothetical protein